MPKIEISRLSMSNIEISRFCISNLEISTFCMSKMSIFCSPNIGISGFCVPDTEISIFCMPKISIFCLLILKFPYSAGQILKFQCSACQKFQYFACQILKFQYFCMANIEISIFLHVISWKFKDFSRLCEPYLSCFQILKPRTPDYTNKIYSIQESLYCSQATFSTQLLKPNLCILHPLFIRKLTGFTIKTRSWPITFWLLQRGNCGKTLRDKLQRLQNRAARILTNSNYDADASILLNDLGWQNLQTQRQIQTAVMVYKCLNWLASHNMSSKFILRSDLFNPYNLRDCKNKHAVPLPRPK